MRIACWIKDKAENQDAGEQKKLNQKKEPDQIRTVSPKGFGNQPNATNCQDKDWNRQNLVYVRRPTTNQQGCDHHEVASNVGGEQFETQEPNYIYHARYRAEQRRKPDLPPRHPKSTRVGDPGLQSRWIRALV